MRLSDTTNGLAAYILYAHVLYTVYILRYSNL